MLQATIMVRDMTLTENLKADSSKEVTFDGGYNVDYTGRAGFTKLKGSITTQYGRVVIKNFILEK